MAIHLGSTLPTRFMSKLRRESRRNSNEVVLLSTIDERGFPNVALLSYLDIVVMSPKRILLAIGEESSTKKNLIRSKKGTITLWGGKDSGIYYVKGRARLVRGKMKTTVEGFTCSSILLTVEKVSQDYSPVAKILSTITYDTSRTNAAHFELLKELRTLSGSI